MPGTDGTAHLIDSTSRSPQVNTQATIFFAVSNGGSTKAYNVRMDMNPGKPGNFSWQNIDCGTAAPTSTVGQNGFNVAAGATVCNILFFTPTTTFDPEQIHIRAQADNSPATTALTGLNTWLLASTSTQGPDLIGLTTTTDFYRTQAEGCTGVKNFAVGSSNVGTGVNNVVVTVHTGAATLRLVISIYEIAPGSGQIIQDGSFNIINSFPGGANKSMLVSVQFNRCIPFVPVNNRIFIVFTEQATGRILGGTSTAVSTER